MPVYTVPATFKNFTQDWEYLLRIAVHDSSSHVPR